MKQQRNVLILVIVLLLLLAGSFVAYRVLSPKLLANNLSVSESEPAGEKEVVAEEGSDAVEEEEPEGEPIEFSFTDREGNLHSFTEFLGKPLVLNCWASWCPPCKAELPDFDAVAAERAGEVTFLMLDLVDGRKETVETGAAYIDSQGFTFPVYFDTLREGAALFGITAIPTTFFFDETGVPIAMGQGALSRETLEKGIAMAEGKAVS